MKEILRYWRAISTGKSPIWPAAAGHEIFDASDEKSVDSLAGMAYKELSFEPGA
jgi:hypothetical protein